MEFDADIAINKMVSYVEPIMLIIMGIVVAFVMWLCSAHCTVLTTA